MFATHFHRLILPVLLVGLFHLKETQSVPTLHKQIIKQTPNNDLRDNNAVHSPVLKSEVKKAVACRIPFGDIGGRCLMVDAASDGSWNEMKNYCRNLGGQLAKIDSGDLLYELIQYIKINGLDANDYWIGGSDTQYEDRFVWVDDTTMKMGSPFWGYERVGGIQEPNDLGDEDCVHIFKYEFYYFNDAACELVKNAICEQVD